MGGIAAGTHAPQLRGLHRGAAETEPEPEPEPDIEMPEVDTPTSETDSEENEGEALFFTGREKGGLPATKRCLHCRNAQSAALQLPK